MLFNTKIYIKEMIDKYHLNNVEPVTMVQLSVPVWRYLNLPDTAILHITILLKEYMLMQRDVYDHSIMINKVKFNFEIPCFRHSFKDYTGFRDVYRYCVCCDEKEYD